MMLLFLAQKERLAHRKLKLSSARTQAPKQSTGLFLFFELPCSILCSLHQKKEVSKNDTSFFGAEGETRPLKAKAFFGTHAVTETVHWTVSILRIALFDSLFFTSKKGSIEKRYFLFWRRRRDSNSRAGYPTYALSRGASSPT